MPQWLLHPTPKVLPASSPSKHLRGWLLSLSIILSCLWKRSCWIKQYSHLASSSNQHWTGAGLRFWWLATNQDDVLCKHTINYIYIYIFLVRYSVLIVGQNPVLYCGMITLGKVWATLVVVSSSTLLLEETNIAAWAPTVKQDSPIPSRIDLPWKTETLDTPPTHRTQGAYRSSSTWLNDLFQNPQSSMKARSLLKDHCSSSIGPTWQELMWSWTSPSKHLLSLLRKQHQARRSANH